MQVKTGIKYRKNTLFGGVFFYGAEGGISFATIYGISTAQLLQYIVVNKHLGTLSEYFNNNKALRLLAKLYFFNKIFCNLLLKILPRKTL